VNSIHYANRGENVDAKAQTHGRSTLLVLEDVDAVRLQLSMDRELAEQVYLLIGRELLAQDKDELALADEFLVETRLQRR
jgi:hypothetical protein